MRNVEVKPGEIFHFNLDKKFIDLVMEVSMY